MSFTILTTRMLHEGGTKDYDLHIVRNSASNRAVLVRRWGAVGLEGQVMTKTFGHYNQARAYAQKIINDKIRPVKGYDVQGDSFKESEHQTLEHAESVLGQKVITELNLSASAKAILNTSGDVTHATAPIPPSPSPAQKAIEKPTHYGSW